MVQQRRVRYAVRARHVRDGRPVVLRRPALVLVTVGRLGGGTAAARARPEQREEHRQQEHAVHGAEHDHQEDHLEEHHEYVAAGQYERGDAQHRAHGALDDRQAQRVQALTDPFLRAGRLGRHVRVAYVRGEVHREPDAHDQVDHRYRVQVDVPQGHVAHHAQLDGHDREGHPQRAQHVRYEQERDQHHRRASDQHGLDGRRSHQFELIANTQKKKITHTHN